MLTLFRRKKENDKVDIDLNKESTQILSRCEMISMLEAIPYWQDKINLFENYLYEENIGSWRRSSSELSTPAPPRQGLHQNALKINYGCGGNLIKGWLNVDIGDNAASNYMNVNLREKHPFQDQSIVYGFSEDMLEHFSQVDSIHFLIEAYRTLAPKGVIRLSFPGLEGVLHKHYTPGSAERYARGEIEAYAFWDHIHFYSRDEIALVARHIGFRIVEFVEYGESKHDELCGLDTRSEQKSLNIFVELTK